MAALIRTEGLTKLYGRVVGIPLVDTLEPWTVLSPFAHYASGDRLREGLDLGATGLLLVLGLLLASAAAESFSRRDLRL